MYKVIIYIYIYTYGISLSHYIYIYIYIYSWHMNLYDHFIHLIYEFVWMHTATRAGGFERLSGGSSWRGYLYPFIPLRRSVRGLRLTPSRSGGSGRRTR